MQRAHRTLHLAMRDTFEFVLQAGPCIPTRTENARICRDEGHRRARYGVLRQRLQPVAWTGASARAVPQETAVSASVDCLRCSMAPMGRKPNSAQLPLPVRYQQHARYSIAVTVGERSPSAAALRGRADRRLGGRGRRVKHRHERMHIVRFCVRSAERPMMFTAASGGRAAWVVSGLGAAWCLPPRRCTIRACRHWTD
jgi:hypothetical protein